MSKKEKILAAGTSIVCVLALLGAGGYLLFIKKPAPTEFRPIQNLQDALGVIERWEKWQVVIPGTYADADAVELPDGRLRMYYALEPEAPGFEAQVYSAVSSDGINFQQEEGLRMKGATFPSVIRLPDGTWRMYFQGAVLGSPPAAAILSAVSKDGLTWTQEAGVRIKRGEEGIHDSENVADPTVVQLPDGTYLMVYRGQTGENRFGRIDEFRKKPTPIDYLISATSKDGLIWTPGTLVVDSKNDDMRDQILGPELVIDGDKLKLYSNSFAGVYVLTLSEKGEKTGEPPLVMGSTGPDDAPSDVTLVKFKNDWKMYYGMHTKGIFKAENADERQIP